ncbi:MAG TPA: redoxin family protein [Nocardioidaceae bacterium]|nr:redoxin family protein [Nocardioidaceae bacterium]
MSAKAGMVVVLLVFAACSCTSPASPRSRSTAPAGPTASDTERPAQQPDQAACPSGDGTPIVGIPILMLPCLTAAGPNVSVSSVHGRPEVINIWASWCGPCKQETPLLQRVHAAIGHRVLFLGVDVRDTRSRALAFLAYYGVSYAQVFDSGGRFPLSLHLAGVPNTLFVDAAGKVVYRRIGALDEQQLRIGLARAGVRLSSLPGG